MANVPLLADCKCQEKLNSGGFNDRTEGFVIINPSLLMKTFCDEAGFVAKRSTSKRGLGFVDPFTANDRVMKRSRNELPHLIL